MVFMSHSTPPSDLAVAFRSLPRRQRDAAGAAPESATAGLTGELDQAVQRSAGLLHTSADAESIAEAIEAVPADAWDDAVLDELRSIALDLGRILRAVAAIAQDFDTTDRD